MKYKDIYYSLCVYKDNIQFKYHKTYIYKYVYKNNTHPKYQPLYEYKVNNQYHTLYAYKDCIQTKYQTIYGDKDNCKYHTLCTYKEYIQTKNHTLYVYKSNTQIKYHTHQKTKLHSQHILHNKFKFHQKHSPHQHVRLHPIYKAHPKHTYFLYKHLGNITFITTNPLTTSKHKYQKTKPNTPKPHPNFKSRPTHWFKPKLKSHAKYSTCIQKTNKNHIKLKRAQPTGLTNIQNKKRKIKIRKGKKKHYKTKTQKINKITNNITRHKPYNTSYQQRTNNSITPIEFKNLLYPFNTNIH